MNAIDRSSRTLPAIPASLADVVFPESKLRRIVPSVFAEEPWHGVSERYEFVSTTTVIRAMMEAGFYPVDAMQSRSRILGKQEYTKHMLRFRHENDIERVMRRVGDEVPEIVLVNSHDRTSAYRAMFGMFRFICENGLVVMSQQYKSISVRHIGSGDGEVSRQIVEASYNMIAQVGAINQRIEAWKATPLSDHNRYVLAQAAVELRPNGITPERLLAPKRSEDQRSDLWTVFNTIQENMMRGGIRGRAETGRRFTTRAISSVSENVRINGELWQLADRTHDLLMA